MIVKLAAAVTCMGLACPGIANAQPLPGLPDIPDVDETFALDYATDHDREVCRILDRPARAGKPRHLSDRLGHHRGRDPRRVQLRHRRFRHWRGDGLSLPAARRAIRGGPGPRDRVIALLANTAAAVGTSGRARPVDFLGCTHVGLEPVVSRRASLPRGRDRLGREILVVDCSIRVWFRGLILNR